MEFLKEIDTLSALKVKALVKDNISICLENLDEVCRLLEDDKRKSVSEISIFLRKEKQKIDEEIVRVKALYDFDRSYGRVVCGVDEVGRGPLAGPIVGCAVVLKNDTSMDDIILEINDSKKLSIKKREELSEIIKKRCLSYAIFEHSNEDIDNLGLSFCNNNIFIEAIKGLNVQPEVVLSDGFFVKGCTFKNERVIKGDAKSAAIACASILAKVYRDNLMKEYDQLYPEYGFKDNVGYGSKNHVKALLELGPCKIHRMSFLRNILEERNE